MNHRVLVVDDSRFIYDEMRYALENTEFTVAGHCVSGEEVLPMYEALHPDLVTMDIVLPGIDGLETSARLLKAHPDARIIIVSSLDYEETEEKAKSLGVETFLFKPFEREDLIRALRFAAGEIH
ncbi:MAG: response regulator [Clostridia bacterium]|nr:response regulator [Clostridia bacterium]